MIKYANEYSDYYNKLKERVKVKIGKNSERKNEKGDIYPRKRNNYGYSYKGQIYSSLKNEKKSITFLEKLIIKTVIALILLSGLFSLKITPNPEAKNIYTMIKKEINRTYDYKTISKNLEKIGIDTEAIMEVFQEKYNGFIKEFNLQKDTN
ncbi:hypothetical protein [Clostridium isatidis]|uniref:Uncharacterized protein n=1 Tax=Clostridium isatidis TaxID=182773 RepID=A0A343JEP1_9CLOT|nr:hypothetical protein [Clostridium isatidis]ASW43999.1 hypothetical protein BEN51_11035 [Clostridium isatidis]NLZ35497.1 hypothetical protein [Clostridiales bacterium]